MKRRISVTLSEDILRELDAAIVHGESRSEAVERLLRQQLSRHNLSERDLRDLDIISAHADELNQEAEDVLRYQVDP